MIQMVGNCIIVYMYNIFIIMRMVIQTNIQLFAAGIKISILGQSTPSLLPISLSLIIRKYEHQSTLFLPE